MKKIIFVFILFFSLGVLGKEKDCLSKKISIQSSFLTLDLKTYSQGVTADLALMGSELSESFKGQDLHLFELQLQQGEKLHKISSKEGWNYVELQKKGKTYYLSFVGFSAIAGCKELKLDIEIKKCAKKTDKDWWKSSAIEFTFGKCIVPKGFHLIKATLAPVSFGSIPKKSRVFYPYSSGLVNDPSVNCHRYIRYPSGFGASMPFFAFYNQGRGLYIGAHDSKATVKDLGIELNADSTQSVRFDYPTIVDEYGRSSLAPCTIVFSAFEGDWFEAAVMYREWMKKESLWYPSSQIDAYGRKDTPLWMKELCLWINGTDIGAVEFQQKFGIPIGLHWYNWHEIPFDNDYPHYFPAKLGFKEKVALLQKKNIYVMPYINGRLWDTHDHMTKDSLFTSLAFPAVTKKKDGTYISEQYGSMEVNGEPVSLGVMCPSTELWKDKMAEVVLNLMGEKGGVNGVYLDQIAAAPPVECFDSTHTHPLGGGDWWVPAYRELLGKIRSQMPSNTVLTTESNADGYVDRFDGYLVWQFSHDGQVPAFGAVYGGLIQLFGRTYRPLSQVDKEPFHSNKMMMAQSFVNGEQLGWFNASLLDNKEMFDYLKPIVDLRFHFREYFYKGQMAKAPIMHGENPICNAKWAFTSLLLPVSNPSVLCGVWEIPQEKKLLMLFVNYSEQEISLEMEYPLVQWNMNTKKIQITQYTQESKQALSSLPKNIRFPAGKAFVIEMIRK